MGDFISLGIALILGVLLGKVMNKLKMPAVGGYIIAGLLIGVSGFNIVNERVIEELSFINDIALGIIAFNIGSEFKIEEMKKLGKNIFVIATCEALGAFTLVTSIIMLLGQNIQTALILGAISSATAPAATVMVLKEYKAKGPLTSTLLGVVAVDDAISLMIYAVASSVAKVFIKHEALTMSKVLIHPIMEIVLSVFVGALIGIILSYLLNKSKNESEVLTFTIASIILLVGISLHFNLSPLLCAMASGIMVTNVSSKGNKAFNTLEKWSSPITAAFFTLAGSRLDISLIPQIGLLGVMYLLFRMIGKVGGASIGAGISKAPQVVKKYIGLGLLSQVGVAVGLAITVSREFPGTALGSIVITILMATTILTEIIGPIATKIAVKKSKESPLLIDSVNINQLNENRI
ncbi:cation:proton antiporter [Tepidibacter formicigenes]|uniref:Transporter, CPA2 family n=1 Tax=Tepidibacter formicigenes DSM 15518 TaxID=1123349 RepID=A0A1M6S2I6_9FIRM|nr:cation:proton antiporter [Tepidibacter formicigenes]SHK39034.1 transporter, CPA2 family [Tepidibacter formicigenes DSM 15518]